MLKQYGNHGYHLVESSGRSSESAAAGWFLTGGLVFWFHRGETLPLMLALFFLACMMKLWWKDIVIEGTHQGHHTSVVVRGLRKGMVLFIVSEVMFFFSFFWAFFHSSLSPAVELGVVWPPLGIQSFNPFQIPLMNTAILLASGFTVTWSHHSILSGNLSQAKQGLFLTIVLGMYFTGVQALEYYESSFTISDSVYGSTFFIATGFHGLHVLIGTFFLIVCLIRMFLGHFSSSHHFGFEAASWYWHFVDVVWLFLFVSIYWWGGL